jgi:hypothetical protein
MFYFQASRRLSIRNFKYNRGKLHIKIQGQEKTWPKLITLAPEC